MSEFNIDQLQEKIKKSESLLKEDLATVRAGRANAALVDKVMVEYYGTPTPLKSLANISVPEPRTLLISPFDPKSIPEIEKAINVANIGINPVNDGKVVRLQIPQVTEERRKELTKTVKKMGEETKVAVRNLRRDANDKVKKLEKAGDYTEDDRKETLDEIQKMVDQAIKDNADVQSGAGLHPKIVRTAEAHCCKWCDDLAGTYDYDDVRATGDPVWARHDNCRCLIEYVADRRERVNNYRRR